MRIIETEFEGLFIIEPVVYQDSRGYFMESFNSESFRKNGIIFAPVQDNESRSAKGVIRGLHYQIKPHDQAKLIRVVDGRILDVALDLRKGSSTFGRWYSIELDSESKKSLLIPRGFAHGFSVLSDKAVIQYKCDRVFNRDAERGISLADPSLGIYWNIDVSKAVISDKDKNNPLFVNAEMNF